MGELVFDGFDDSLLFVWRGKGNEQFREAVLCEIQATVVDASFQFIQRGHDVRSVQHDFQERRAQSVLLTAQPIRFIAKDEARACALDEARDSNS